MIKKIIPKILYDTKFKKQSESGNSCVYNYNDDFIVFNRKRIKEEKHINSDICNYFGKKFTNKDILLISLFHELAHRFRYITNISQNIAQINKERHIYDTMFKNHHTSYYYLLIKEEREAMKLAESWFNQYKKIK
jgi:hypothetical protein